MDAMPDREPTRSRRPARSCAACAPAQRHPGRCRCRCPPSGRPSGPRDRQAHPRRRAPRGPQERQRGQAQPGPRRHRRDEGPRRAHHVPRRREGRRVSNWLVYAEGVREHVEAARKGQAGRQARSQQAGTTVGAASLATDLEITRAELRRTRDERDRLRAKVQCGLGHQVTQAGTADLAARIRDLTARIGSQDAELAQARDEVTGLTTERDAALDEVAGLRAALRQMTRQQNTVH